MFAAEPFSGGEAALARRAAAASDGLAPRTVSPNAAAALRRSIDERLNSDSSSLAKNSCSCAS